MIIYKILSKFDNKIYIGQSIRSLQERIMSYRSEDNNRPIINAMRTYGMNNFIFEIIDTADNINQLNEKEIYWIKYFNSTNEDMGYNVLEGGCNSPWSESAKKKLSEQRLGENNPFYGKTHSGELKNKMSIRMTGKIIQILVKRIVIAPKI